MKNFKTLGQTILVFVMVFVATSCVDQNVDSQDDVKAEQLEGMWLTVHADEEAIESVNAAVLSFGSGVFHKYCINDGDFADFGPYTVSFDKSTMTLQGENVRYEYHVKVESSDSISIKLLKKEVDGVVESIKDGKEICLARIDEDYSLSLYGIWRDIHTLEDGGSDISVIRIGSDGTMDFELDRGTAKIDVRYKIFGNLFLQIAGNQTFGLVIDNVTTIDNQMKVLYHSQYPNGVVLYGSCIKMAEEVANFDESDLYGGYWVNYTEDGEIMDSDEKAVFKYYPDGTQMYARWNKSEKKWEEEIYSFEFMQDSIRYFNDTWSSIYQFYYLNNEYMIDASPENSYYSIKSTSDFSGSILGTWYEADEESYYEFLPSGQVNTYLNEDGTFVKYEERYHLYGNYLVWEYEEGVEPVLSTYIIDINNGFLIFDAKEDRADKAIRCELPSFK